MGEKYRWAAIGDINAFFGLMLDNVAGLILIVSLLHQNFDFPVEFALRHMIPGTAIGVFLGDLAFFFLAFRLARTTGSRTVTAMPLGLDTPSTFGMVFFVLGPAYRGALAEAGSSGGHAVQAAALHAWHIGICSIFFSGVLKVCCSFGSGWVRRVVPRAGLLGSLAAIALVLISFLPLLEILRYPLVGLVAMSIILTALIARLPLPGRVPGAVGGLIVAGGMFLLLKWTGMLGPTEEPLFDPYAGLFPSEWLSALSFSWMRAVADSVHYLPIVLPFALATVVGGIDCAESAAAAGDDYPTSAVIGIEAVATLLASFCGAVVQTTPYIGHPAYKAMGGRAAYTLATALMMGILGTTGLFGYFYQLIPKAAVFPILVFVGLEIAAQSFLATPRRHYPAVAIACIPALASLAIFFVNQLWGDGALVAAGINPATLQKHELQSNLATTSMLANGFILTSITWSSALAMAIDRRLVAAAGFYLVAAFCTLFGLMHSPLANAPILAPVGLGILPSAAVLPQEHLSTVLNWTIGYVGIAMLMVVWDRYLRATDQLPQQASNQEDH
ncbi:MAG: permease [Pirellulaceae bacterium]|nr:MAG: permease [Pirellulaceae bacterium]